MSVSGFAKPLGARKIACELGGGGDDRNHLDPIREIRVVESVKASDVRRDGA